MASPQLSLLENSLKQQLMPIFANLSEDILDICVRDPSNLSNLQLCIDDLLELRTYTRHLAVSTADSSDSWRRDPVVVDSDDDGDLVSALLSAESQEVQITQQFPPTRRLDTDCLLTDVDSSKKKRGSSMKIREATFICPSPGNNVDTSVSLLDEVEFDNDLPRLSTPSKTKTNSPADHKVSANNATPSSRANTSTSILDAGHTAVVQQWRQNQIQSLFTSPTKARTNEAGPKSQISDITCDSQTVFQTKSKSADVCVAKIDQKPKSAVSGILSPAKLKLPGSPLKEKLPISNSHKYRFNPDSFHSSPAQVIRPSVFNPGKNATEPLTAGTSNVPHDTLTTNSVVPLTSGTSQDTTPKQIKFKKSLILPGDRLPATTATSKTPLTSTSDKQQSSVSNRLPALDTLTRASQNNGLSAETSNLNVLKSLNGKEVLHSTTNGSQKADYSNRPWLHDQSQRSSNANQVLIPSKSPQKTSSKCPWIPEPVATSNSPHPLTSNKLQGSSGPQSEISNKWPWLQTTSSTNSTQSSNSSKHQTVSQVSQNSTINSKYQTVSQVPKTSTINSKHQTVSQVPHNSTINSKYQTVSQLPKTSTINSKHQTVSQVPHNSTISSKYQTVSQVPKTSTINSKHQTVSQVPQTSTISSKHQTVSQVPQNSTINSKYQTVSQVPQSSTINSKYQAVSQVPQTSTINSKYQAVSQVPQSSTISKSLESITSLIQSTDCKKTHVTSNAPNHLLVSRPLASKSTVAQFTNCNRLLVTSKTPQNPTINKSLVPTPTVTQHNSSSVQRVSEGPHDSSLSRPPSMLRRQQSAYSTSKAEVPTTAKLSVTANIPLTSNIPSTAKIPSAAKIPSTGNTSSNTLPGSSNDNIVASASGDWRATPNIKPPSSMSKDGIQVLTDQSRITNSNTILPAASLGKAQDSKAVSASQTALSNRIPTAVPKLNDQAALPVHLKAAAPGVTKPKADLSAVTASAAVRTSTVTNPASGAKPQADPSKEIPAPKSRTKCLVEDVLALFGDADPEYVRRMVEMELLTQRPDHEIVNNLCNLLLENHTYPRVQPSATVTIVEVNNTPEIDDTDYYQEYKKNEHQAGLYYSQTEKLLMHQFMWISAQCVRQVLRWYSGYYAPTHQVLGQVMKQRKEDIKKDKGDVPYSLKLHSLHAGATINITVAPNSKERPLSVTLLKNWRKTSPPPLVGLDPFLQREVNFIKRKQQDEFEEADHQMALMLNETEYEESGQLIECGCCYGEVPFENMIQCYEGHLFCDDCLQRYAKEAVFGAGKADLMCMTEGCDASYPVTQLSKALPSSILSKYEDRVQEENLNLADLSDLVRCPHCDFAAVLDPGYSVFRCANPACEKETCRHCQEPWADHIGKTCDQVEKKDEVKLRVQFEEKMTMAKIRTCIKCKTKFTKSEGCNKMTCRCGSKMCYICRKPNIDYNHFCQHVREPGKGCDKCTACFLWSTGEVSVQPVSCGVLER
ncbi:E3 ubiquitin-protein ligase [Mizuhopecten yessoensis]|uniref:E3 ubiquitin-protein ligase n=1 Tax=Mizuhopecten yessoensis TaxID=6573 RepID=A0A210Q448_MIZYE|nr:E3 ubiquitin-protein ligase [Mizuhopecten yessoensis]